MNRPLVRDVRKKIPLSVKLAVALRALGHREGDVEFDHDPALALRAWKPKINDFDPRQLDPEFIIIRTKVEHRQKTFGRKVGAERTVTTLGSDIGEAARTRRLARKHAAHLAHMDGDEPVRPPRKVRKIPCRVGPWPKGRKIRRHL